VALGTLGFAEEQYFPAPGIPWELNDVPPALQDPQPGNDVPHVLWFQGRESRHTRTGDSIANDAGKLAIHEVLHFRSGSNVGCVFAAPAIRTVTTSAVGGKDGSAWLLCLQSPE
jgi:hypothetical protein